MRRNCAFPFSSLMPDMLSVFSVGFGKTCSLPRVVVVDAILVVRIIIVVALSVKMGSLKSK